MLQTCLLPDREQPYVLSIELARHRIKMFIAKSEEWQMFDLSAEHPAMKLWEEARRLFTEAWISDDIRSRRTRLAATVAEPTPSTPPSGWRWRMPRSCCIDVSAKRAASSSTLGVRIWPGRDAQPLRDLIAKEFDLVVIPLNWREIEVTEGKYNWDPVDRWMEWASKQSKPIVAGPLLDFSKRAVPEWMYVWQHDYDTCRDMAYDHMRARGQALQVAWWACGISRAG